MIWLYAAQLALPLILIGWMLWMPARGGLTFLLQVFGSFAAIGAMTFQGIWLLPPWWAPYAFAIALGVATRVGWRRLRPFARLMPTTSAGWVVSIFFAVLCALSVYGTATALQSRTTPLGVVNLAFPLESGRYLVVNGGSNSSTNAHFETLDPGVPRYREWRGQSYGVDMVALNGLGLRAHGVQPGDPLAYFIYSARVLAPCAGQVVVALDGLPDMQVPDTDHDHLAGNHVLLRCADADVLLGHLQRGSVQVVAGAKVAAGEWLGRVGNSGNTGEPHLHIHAQGIGPINAPLGGDPHPIQFNGRFPVRGNLIEIP